jgi:hypothetical protein
MVAGQPKNFASQGFAKLEVCGPELSVVTTTPIRLQREFVLTWTTITSTIQWAKYNRDTIIDARH